MTNKFKIILFLPIAMLGIGLLLLDYVKHGGERDLNDEKPLFEVTSKKIIEEFTTNIDSANLKYIDKAIAVSGIVTAVKNHEVIVDNTLICNLKNINNDIKVDQNIIMKGRVVGYDDLLSELKLDKCSVNN